MSNHTENRGQSQETRKNSIEGQTLKEHFADKSFPQGEADQHHGESTKAPQDERNIGQHNGAGRPPLMKK